MDVLLCGLSHRALISYELENIAEESVLGNLRLTTKSISALAQPSNRWKTD